MFSESKVAVSTKEAVALVSEIDISAAKAILFLVGAGFGHVAFASSLRDLAALGAGLSVSSVSRPPSGC